MAPQEMDDLGPPEHPPSFPEVEAQLRALSQIELPRPLDRASFTKTIHNMARQATKLSVDPQHLLPLLDAYLSHDQWEIRVRGLLVLYTFLGRKRKVGSRFWACWVIPTRACWSIWRTFSTIWNP